MADGPTPASDAPVSDRHGSLLAQISRDMVGIYARFYGRGPTKAKTVWREEIVICVLQDVFTKAEQVLASGGHFGDVRAARVAFQDEVEPLFRAIVEAATECQVRSFLSQVSVDGVAAEVFVLAHRPASGRRSAGLADAGL